MLLKNRAYQHGGSLRGPPILRRAKRSGGLDFSKPPQSRLGVSNGLLYDGFFSFAVVRQQALIPIVIKLFHDSMALLRLFNNSIS